MTWSPRSSKESQSFMAVRKGCEGEGIHRPLAWISSRGIREASRAHAWEAGKGLRLGFGSDAGSHLAGGGWRSSFLDILPASSVLSPTTCPVALLLKHFGASFVHALPCTVSMAAAAVLLEGQTVVIGARGAARAWGLLQAALLSPSRGNRPVAASWQPPLPSGSPGLP